MVDPLEEKCPCGHAEDFKQRSINNYKGEPLLDERWRQFRKLSGKEAKFSRVGKAKNSRSEKVSQFYPKDSASVPGEVWTKLIYLRSGASAETVKANSPAEITKMLLKERYPDIANYDGKRAIKSTSVPETYISNNPEQIRDDVIDSEIDVRLGEAERKRAHEISRKSRGEEAERNVEIFLEEEYFKRKPNCLSIRGIEMGQPNPDDFKKSKREVDFIILDPTRQLIICIEVKRCLKKHENKLKSELENALEQLEKDRQRFAEWFGQDLKSISWKFVPLVYCERKEQDVTLCSSCEKSVAIGIKELEEILESVQNPEMREPDDLNVVEDFKFISRYLLFLVSVVELPTVGNLPQHVREALQKAGEFENVKLWCFLYPQQAGILEKSKVIFVGGFGTGKTMLMTEKVKQICENLDQKEKRVLLVVFVYKEETNGKPTLLVHDLRIKLMEWKDRVDILHYFFDERNENFDDLLQLTENYDHVLFDECFSEIFKPSEDKQWYDQFFATLRSAIEDKDTAWIAFSNCKENLSALADWEEEDNNIFQTFSDVKERLMAFFPPLLFSFPCLEWTMRTPKKIFEKCTPFFRSKPDREDINSQLLMNSTISENQPHGKFEQIHSFDFRSSIIKGLEKIDKSSRIILIIDANQLDFLDLIKSIFGVTSSINDTMEIISSAFVSSGRKSPLCLLSKDLANIEDSICNWVKREDDRDLVTEAPFIKGYEHGHILISELFDHETQKGFLDVQPLSRTTFECVCSYYKGIDGSVELGNFFSDSSRQHFAANLDDFLLANNYRRKDKNTLPVFVPTPVGARSLLQEVFRRDMGLKQIEDSVMDKVPHDTTFTHAMHTWSEVINRGLFVLHFQSGIHFTILPSFARSESYDYKDLTCLAWMSDTSLHKSPIGLQIIEVIDEEKLEKSFSFKQLAELIQTPDYGDDICFVSWSKRFASANIVYEDDYNELFENILSLHKKKVVFVVPEPNILPRKEFIEEEFEKRGIPPPYSFIEEKILPDNANELIINRNIITTPQNIKDHKFDYVFVIFNGYSIISDEKKMQFINTANNALKGWGLGKYKGM